MTVDIMPPVSSRWDPDAAGRFGRFGGRYLPETLMPAAIALAEAYAAARTDASFWTELHKSLTHYVGRPSPLYHAARLSDRLRGARIYLKREDLNHTGAHKINNTMGQVLLARRLGKRRIIAETGAGQHGVATATAAACHGLECVVYMGAEDVRRQKLNVFRMELLGATVVSVDTGQRTLKDAINAALRDWMASSDSTHYVIGSVMGPHPYPLMVRDFQSVVGREARAQCLAQTGRLPDAVLACVGGGSNAAGIFSAFLDDAVVRLIGVEAAGDAAGAGMAIRAATVRERSSSALRPCQAEQSSSALPPYQGGTQGGSSNAHPGSHEPLVRESVLARSPHGNPFPPPPLTPGRHAATLSAGRPGVLHGMYTYVLQDDDGQTAPVHSVSAGLDYPGVGPEHAHWKESGRVDYFAATDADALAAFTTLCETEGIIPALESAHAIAHAMRVAPTMDKDATLVVNLSGRGDKDVNEVGRLLGRFRE